MKLLSVLLLMCAPALAAPTVPAEVQGRWLAGGAGATNYWDANGTFQGGSGNGQLLTIDAKGHYTRHQVMEVSSGYITSRVRTNSEGSVTVEGDHLTLHPSSGHYHGEMGTKIIDRPMNADELAKASRTYQWVVTPGADGKPHLVFPFEDGSRIDFEPATTP